MAVPTKLTSLQLLALQGIPVEAAPCRVRLAIAFVGCRQKDLGNQLGWTPKKVSRAVAGQLRSLGDAQALANLLGCSVDDLFPQGDLEPGSPVSQEPEGSGQGGAAAALPSDLDKSYCALEGADVDVDDLSIHGGDAEGSSDAMPREKRGEDSREGAAAR